MLISYQPELHLLSSEKHPFRSTISISPDKLYNRRKCSISSSKGTWYLGLRECFQEYFGFRKGGERQLMTLVVALRVAAPTPWSCTWTGASTEPHLCQSVCTFINTQLIIVPLVHTLHLCYQFTFISSFSYHHPASSSEQKTDEHQACWEKHILHETFLSWFILFLDEVLQNQLALISHLFTEPRGWGFL